MKPRSIIGYSLGYLGVLVVLATIGLEVWIHLSGRAELPSHLVYASLVAGAVIGWWGFFWADSTRAVRGGDWVIAARDRLRPGKRADDPPDLRVAPAVVVPASDGMSGEGPS